MKKKGVSSNTSKFETLSNCSQTLKEGFFLSWVMGVTLH